MNVKYSCAPSYLAIAMAAFINTSSFARTTEPPEKKEGTIQITIVIDQKLTTPIQQKTEFKVGDQTFVAKWSYVGVTTKEAVVSFAQRLITERPDGKFEFTIPVENSRKGFEFKVEKGAKLTPGSKLSGVLDAYVAEDATGWTKQATTEAEKGALREDSEKQVAALVEAAIPKYYEWLITEYPHKAARKASEGVGGGQLVEEALKKRFKIDYHKHQPPDTPLDRELGTKTAEAFAKVLAAATARYNELRVTSRSTAIAARNAADGSERLDDILRALDPKYPIKPGSVSPSDLQILTGPRGTAPKANQENAPAAENTKAIGWLKLAEQYFAIGDTTKANEYARKIVAEYPGTPEAEKAKQYLLPEK